MEPPETPKKEEGVTDEVIREWALSTAKYSLAQENRTEAGRIYRSEWEHLIYYEGVELTPENSYKMEHLYLEDIERRRRDERSLPQYKKLTKKEYEKEWMRQLLRDDLYFLSKYGLLYDKLEFYIHFPMSRFSMKFGLGPGQWKRGNIQMPRSTCKTTIGTLSDAGRRMLINPNVRILIQSNEESLAADNLVEARTKLIDSPVIRQYFPEYIPTRISDARGRLNWTVPCANAGWKEGTITAAGGGQGKTGQHYDFIYLDDLWDAKSVQSVKTNNNTIKNFNKTKFLLVKQEKSVIINVCTRWSHSDPSDILYNAPEYKHMLASAIKPDGTSLFEPLSEDGLGYTTKALYNMHEEDAYSFFCQMMNNPQNTKQGFQKDWFQYLSFKALQAEHDKGNLALRTVALVDLAATSSETSDYSALVIVGFVNDGRTEKTVVVAAYNEKTSPERFRNLVFSQCDRFNCERMVMQKQSVESAQKPEYIRENRERSGRAERVIPITDYHLAGANQNKDARIQSLAIPFERGRMWFNKDVGTHTEALEAVRNQLLTFPFAVDKDDLIDALSMINLPEISRSPSYKSVTSEPVEQLTANQLSQKLRKESELAYKESRRPRREEPDKDELYY